MKTKLNICHHMLTSSTQLQNRSFHVVERMRTSSKCQDGKCTCKACKNTVFYCQICKFVGFLLPSSSWLLKLPIREFKGLTKLGSIVAETLLRMQMFPSLAARETCVAETNFAARENKKCFCLESKTFLLPGHKFCVRNICFPV